MYEGTIIRNKSSLYECGKRSYNCQKMKDFFEDEAIIIDTVEGKGKYVNSLGTIVCEYKDRCFEIGTGFSDEERLSLYLNRDKIINQSVTFKYQCLTSNNVPRFPVFKSIRNYE
jgi:DNA ligase-1